MGRLRQRTRKRRRERPQTVVDPLAQMTRIEVISHAPGQKPFVVFDHHVRDWDVKYDVERADITSFGDLGSQYIVGKRTFRLEAQL